MNDVHGASLDDIEAAFARLAPVVKGRMARNAKLFHPELRGAGFSVLRAVLLSAVRRPDEDLTVSKLVAGCHMDKSVVSRQLKDLKQWDLIQLERSQQDARVYLVSPTPMAMQRFQEIKESTRADYEDLFATWEPKDISDLASLLLRFSEQIEERFRD
ncbi:MarR family winged helix-turn-helix transcriptional regulator [Glutamicibacter mishrai]|uniref:MarR family transcriptional regulator n=1 Tax=Glutamicibacter mishrai TaxID=1775880 RepID=A0A6H0SG37_9MICC|nr:MarR family winged helix-turn-helix transcriptional regulator [Glutamicibacter mishrai]QIV86130.1 MarR family transcriptional regulator [Glutamicibacter mishrai]